MLKLARPLLLSLIVAVGLVATSTARAALAEDVMSFQMAWNHPVAAIPVGTSDISQMLLAYGATTYPDYAANLVYMLHVSTIEMGSDRIATVTPVTAVSAIVNGVRRYNINNELAGQVDGEVIRSAVQQMILDGAVFGYDGHAIGDCGTPTTKILILDWQSQVIYSVDLEPCLS